MADTMDLHTLHVSSALTNLTCGIILTGACIVRRERTVLGWWACAFFVFGLGILLQVMQQRHPAMGALTYGLLVGGSIVMLAGFRAFDGARPFSRLLIASLVAPPVASLALGMIFPGEAWTELVIFVVSCAVTVQVPFYVILHNPERLAFRWGLGATFAAQLLVTIGVVLFGSAVVTPASVTLAISLTDQICSTIVIACMLGLMMERDNRRLDKLAHSDALTGCLNRAGLMSYSRTTSGPHGVLLVDLDHFKKLNDEYGHAAGDEVLCEFVRRADESLPRSALLARSGGEEFVVLLPGLPPGACETVAARLNAAVSKSGISYEGRPIRFTVSIGVAGISGDETISAGIRRADAALYRAKRAGRNRVVVGDVSLAMARGRPAAA